MTRDASWAGNELVESLPKGAQENSPGRGPREQVFVRGVEDKRSAVLGCKSNRSSSPVEAMRNTATAARSLGSERGPRRFSVPGSPKSGLCSLGWSSGVPKERSLLFGVEFRGGESKDLRLLLGIPAKNFGDRTLERNQSQCIPKTSLSSRRDPQGAAIVHWANEATGTLVSLSS